MKSLTPTVLLLTSSLLGLGQKATPIQEPGVFATAFPVREEAGRYTSEARKTEVKGIVEVAVMVGVDGSPRGMRVVHGLGHGLDQSALVAVRHWRFKPRLVEGQPVESELVVSVPFDPSVNLGP